MEIVTDDCLHVCNNKECPQQVNGICQWSANWWTCKSKKDTDVCKLKGEYCNGTGIKNP